MNLLSLILILMFNFLETSVHEASHATTGQHQAMAVAAWKNLFGPKTAAERTVKLNALKIQGPHQD
jgi:hypothetical protein